MTTPSAKARAAIEWGWAGRALEPPSGDLHVVVPFPGGALVALLDGLGHGPLAAMASQAAEPVLKAHASDPVLQIVQRCHDALQGTRGAVMSIASFSVDNSSVTWTGVGNVDGFLLRKMNASGTANEAMALRGGVVGSQLPPLRATTCTVSTGDTLIMVTDGIRSAFTSGLSVDGSPQEIAEWIVNRFARETDDAHVDVARYLGTQ